MHTSITDGDGNEIEGEFALKPEDTILQAIIERGSINVIDSTSLLFNYQGMDAIVSPGSSYPSPASIMKKRLVEFSGGYIGNALFSPLF